MAEAESRGDRESQRKREKERVVEEIVEKRQVEGVRV